MTVLVSYAAYVGATTAVAKKDHRLYLEGIFIDSGGYLVATDGHRLFCSAIEPGHGPHIVCVKGKAPARFHHARLDVEARSVSFFDQDCVQLASLPLSVISANYPDWKRAADGFPVVAVEAIGLDLTYMADAAKIAKAYGNPRAKFEFHGANRAVKIHFSPDAWMSLMPCRL